jgi:hypothetical protein
MIETAAYLIDNVLPSVPVRQWVLSFPWSLRLLFAREPKTHGQCLAVVTRAIETDLIKRAGLTSASGAQSGVVTLIQRFGSALNLNIHLHMIVLDGVYSNSAGKLNFHRVIAPSQKQLETLLNRIIQRLIRKLERTGKLIADPEQLWLDLADPESLDDISAASIRYRMAIGPHSGNRTLTINNPALAIKEGGHKSLTTNREGFSLNAAVACQPHQRARLERLWLGAPASISRVRPSVLTGCVSEMMGRCNIDLNDLLATALPMLCLRRSTFSVSWPPLSQGHGIIWSDTMVC